MQTLSQVPVKRSEVPAEPVDLLARLVALNAQRAAEEKTGRIRWLRPEFQYPQHPAQPAAGQSLSNQELRTRVNTGLQADLALNLRLTALEASRASSTPSNG